MCKSLHVENYKSMLKCNQNGQNKSRNMPCSWIGSLKDIKMPVFLKFTFSGQLHLKSQHSCSWTYQGSFATLKLIKRKFSN